MFRAERRRLVGLPGAGAGLGARVGAGMPIGAPSHGPRAPASMSHSKQLEDKRREKQNRDYDYAWRRVRAKVLREQPVCECGAATTDVDHILSIKTRPDLRLASRNLRAFCHSCHSKRTARDQGGYGTKHDADR